MKNAVIIVIGTEVLSGHTLDTNSHFLAKQLNKNGLHLEMIVVIHDKKSNMKQILQMVMGNENSIDYILITGGLGPTWDDKTAESLAYALNREYILNEDALNMVKERYKALKDDKKISVDVLTKARKKMAWMPKNSAPLYNSVGTAPGLAIKGENNIEKIFSLPGVPEEMKTMFLKEVLPRIVSDSHFYVETVNVKISGESLLAPVLEWVHDRYPEVYIKSMPIARPNEGTIKVIFQANCHSKSDAKEKVNAAIDEFYTQLDKKNKENSKGLR